jgi:hypothetical protein
MLLLLGLNCVADYGAAHGANARTDERTHPSVTDLIPDNRARAGTHTGADECTLFAGAKRLRATCDQTRDDEKVRETLHQPSPRFLVLVLTPPEHRGQTR